MFLQQKLNPAPPDPVQARMFQFMPIMFTFMLARFPAGLSAILDLEQSSYRRTTMADHAPGSGTAEHPGQLAKT